ncbi:MAG: hypothetical protein Q8N18_06785 [Opitutaceae bacterium]|nr:hypothetical protein [Opitutaceae bacterium]
MNVLDKFQLSGRKALVPAVACAAPVPGILHMVSDINRGVRAG